MGDLTEGFGVVPTALRRFVGAEYGGASDDVARAHHGLTCVVEEALTGDDEGKYVVMFADGAQAIAFADELHPIGVLQRGATPVSTSGKGC